MSKVEQTEILRRVTASFHAINAAAAEAGRASLLLDRLDQSILAKAFRGELLPQDPADEPASVLIERVRADRAKPDTPKRRGRPARASG
jgi:type I restriction enzyme S subunit